MSTCKAKIDFTGYPGAQLGPVAQRIHDPLAANAATFPALPFPLTTSRGVITAFTTALARKASRATADMVAFEIARHALETDRGLYADAVNAVACGLSLHSTSCVASLCQ